jgi:hypothetical protein
MSALIILSYITAIVIGVRWQTLPEDIANIQALLTVGVSFSWSIVKQLCKKRLSIDNSLVYPRPPRTQIDVSTQEETIDHSDDSEDEKVEDENDESETPESEEDADVHGDTEEPEKED